MTDSKPSSGPGAAPPAGWYDDPHGRFEFRYYNGERWTADVSNGGVRTIDHTGQPVVRPTRHAQPTAAATATTTAAGDPRRSRRFALTSFWVALGSLLVAWVPFLFVGAAGGAVVAGVFGLLALRAMRHTGGHGRRFAVAGVVIAPLALALCVVGALLTVKVVREVERFTQPGRYALVQNLPCSVSGTTVTLTGTIRNLENDPREYSLTVDFLSGSSVEKKVTVDIDPVAPQFESGWISTAFVTGSNITCRVSNVTGPRPFDLPTP